MGNLALFALRIVLAVVLAGSVFVQVVMLPLIAIDLDEADDPALSDLDLTFLAVVFLVLVFLCIVMAQVVLVCVWKLLTMVRRGTVFSPGAFRYVDIVIAAIASARC